MSQGFNLVNCAWIPCITPDGEINHQGLLGALEGANRFAEIRADSPLVTVAVHRVLLAVLHRLFGPETPDAWEALWKCGRFDMAKVNNYLMDKYSRFELFDDKHPFYQTGSLPLAHPERRKPRKRSLFGTPMLNQFGTWRTS